MGARVCGARCHRAITANCRCWCGGLFHGHTSGLDARLEFMKAFHLDKLPTTERRFREITGTPELFDDPQVGVEWRTKVEDRSCRS